MSPNARTALDTLIDGVKKKYGEGILMSLNIENKRIDDVISSGSITLDIALGVGGYKRGRIIELFGEESSGKTTCSLHAIANAQKMGLVAAFLDVEHSFDPLYASKLGVNLDTLLFSQPDCGEQGLDLVDTLAKSGQVGLIVVDSVAALTPKKEIEGEIEDQQIGLQARMMSKAMRMFAGSLAKTNTTLIFTNQMRQKIGIVYGNPAVTCGGNSLKFYASQRLEIKRGTQLKQGEEVIGNEIKVKIVKNKVAAPFKEAHFEIKYGLGIDKMSELINMAVEYELIKKAGSWYSYEDTKLGQGKDNVVTFFKENPDIKSLIENKVMELSNLA